MAIACNLELCRACSMRRQIYDLKCMYRIVSHLFCVIFENSLNMIVFYRHHIMYPVKWQSSVRHNQWEHQSIIPNTDNIIYFDSHKNSAFCLFHFVASSFRRFFSFFYFSLSLYLCRFQQIFYFKCNFLFYSEYTLFD